MPFCVRVETRTYQLSAKVRAGTPALQPAGRPALQFGLHLRADLAGEAFPDEFVAVGEEFFQRKFAGVYFGQ